MSVISPTLVFAQGGPGAPGGAGGAESGCPILCVDWENLKSYVNGTEAVQQTYPDCTDGDTGSVSSSFEVETGDAAQTFTYEIEVSKEGETISSSTATITLGANTSTDIPVNVSLSLTDEDYVVTIFVHSATAGGFVRSKFFYFRPDFEFLPGL